LFVAFDPRWAVAEPNTETYQPDSTGVWDVDWSNPNAVAALRAEVDGQD